ncbi:uncharacterized protein LOC143838826 [Paroedura picta]|uniref:uncharacterized protein LOC143838826 n=1 Tax=Paroedura picta TaxID=143630 RepID=UPI004056CBC6
MDGEKEENEIFCVKCVLKEFLWIGLFGFISVIIFAIQVAKTIISRRTEEVTGPEEQRPEEQVSAEEPSTPAQEAQNTDECPETPSNDYAQWKAALCKNLFPEETEEEETIQPSEAPVMECRVIYGPPPNFRADQDPWFVPKTGRITEADLLKRRDALSAQQKTWGFPQLENKKTEEDVFQRGNTRFAQQKPWGTPQVERKRTEEDVFQRGDTRFAQQPWIAPQFDRKKAGDERKYSIYGQQKTWGIPQRENKKTEEDIFQRGNTRFIQLGSNLG